MRPSIIILFIWLICGMLLIGCRATQSASAVFESNTQQRKDSLVYIEKLRVDTVMLKGDSVTVKIPVPCDSLKPVTGKAKSGRVNLNYAIKNGQLEIECNADSLLIQVLARDIEIFRLKRELQNTSKQKQEVITVTKTVTKYRTPFWNWVLIAALLAWIFRWQLLKGVKMLAKIPLPWK